MNVFLNSIFAKKTTKRIRFNSTDQNYKEDIFNIETINIGTFQSTIETFDLNFQSIFLQIEEIFQLLKIYFISQKNKLDKINEGKFSETNFKDICFQILKDIEIVNQEFEFLII